MSIFGDPLIPVISYEGATYGSAFLKSLQTEKLPELDLLVRESVQNSSDAAIGLDGKNIHVDYTFETFDTARFTQELGKVGELLEKQYGSANHFLEIRDSKTSGLTGPYDANLVDGENHGNYFKLIFDTGINQTQDGAGGNWGFGKSVYYRVGVAGVVVFYTQVAGNGKDVFEERLIVTMVEDESSDGAILKACKENPTGRAWWGRPDADEGAVWPVTDHESIVKFLDIFNLRPFPEGETGTSVIIPFVDEAKILEDVIPKGELDEDELRRCTFANSAPAYLRHALQKWYAPRLYNKKLKKLSLNEKWIRARVSGEPVGNSDSMQPFFKLVQDLYNTALFCSKGIDYEPDFSSIECQKISLRGESLKSSVVGYVAFLKLTNRELYPYQSGLSPYVLTGSFENDSNENEPIVMFAREPGMVICYSIDGTWSKKVVAPKKNPESGDDEYIVAFFVPCVENEFTNSDDGRKEAFRTLGGYLRKCEESDHASWEDKAKFQLIKKIRSHVGSKIADGVTVNEEDTFTGQPSRLSRSIGRALLPTRDMLAPVRSKAKGGGSGGSSSGKKAAFSTGNPVWRDGALAVPFQLRMRDRRKAAVVVEVQTESGTISAEAWGKDIGTPFPVEIIGASAGVDTKDGELIQVECAVGEHCENDPISAVLCEKDGRSTRFEVSCEVPGQTLSGEIRLLSLDPSKECVVKAV